MTKLTDRLQLMADNITKGQTMADIGTDHGFLPLYLYENGICPKVILADVSAGSLDKAKENCGENEAFDYRLGDGLKVLEYGEVDAVAIAGMGGRLMCKILGVDIQKIKSYKKFILQPRNGQGELRKWLIDNGFYITRELLVREGKFICEIIVAEPYSTCVEQNDGKSTDKCNEKDNCSEYKEYKEAFEQYGEIAYELPVKLLKQNELLGKELILRRLATEERILDSLKESKADTEEKRAEIKSRITYINKILGVSTK